MLKVKDPLFTTVKIFLESRSLSDQPILIGYSGGCDSKALLYLTLECKRFFEFPIHVAHIDHGWRKESSKQAKVLQEEVEKIGLPFYIKRLSLEEFEKKNLELQGREKRLAFFKQIYQEINAQALLLAHQAEDQAEVVLKRICEGAHFTALRGIQSEVELEGMRIWRPLLSVSKKTLSNWLRKKNFLAIEDPTNADPKFLRARMRKEIFPELNRLFGKEITVNLCKLGRQAQELDSYFYKKNLPLFARQQKMLNKIEWDLTPFLPLARLELYYAVKHWLHMQEIRLSSSSLDVIVKYILENAKNKEFAHKKMLLKIDTGRLILVKNSIKN